jgi:hypothetical protein
MTTKKLRFAISLVFGGIIVLYITSNICVWFNACVGKAVNLLFP